jgi:diguanylate cyclase (GGDEF)-like protein
MVADRHAGVGPIADRREFAVCERPRALLYIHVRNIVLSAMKSDTGCGSHGRFPHDFSSDRLFKVKATAFFVLAILLWPFDGGAAEPASPNSLSVVDLQLRWKHQFQFAGYYAAIEQGYYRDAGVEVRLHEGGEGKAPVDEVLAGRAQYAAGNSEVLYQKLRGRPLVALAAILQHSPSVLLARADSGIRTPHDLIGKKVMLMSGRHDSDFFAMFLREGIAPESIQIIPTSYDVEDLIRGKVDAFNSYLTNEPFVMQERLINYVVINPSHYGIDYYGDILFTSEKELADFPERVDLMRTATLKGWRYAMDHPEKIIDLLIDKYHVPKSRAHLAFEAKALRALILPDLVDIGHMNFGRWQAMAEAFKSVGMVDQQASLDGFVYDAQRHVSDERVKAVALFLCVIIVMILVVVVLMFVVQKRLRREIALRQDVEKQLSRSNDMLKRVGKMAKVGGWEFDFVNHRQSWTDEAVRLRELAPEAGSHEQALALVAPAQGAEANGTTSTKSWEDESQLTTVSGQRIWIHSRGEALIRDGTTVLSRGTMQDVTERKIAELSLLTRTSELEMHIRILRHIHQGDPLLEILSYMTRQIETLHPDMVCSVKVVDPESRRLYEAVAPSLPDYFVRAIDDLGDNAGASLPGLFQSELVIFDDPHYHPYGTPLRDVAKRAGLYSCRPQQIRGRGGRLLGWFSFYQREPARPGDDSIGLIESYANLAELVIERHHAEQQIRTLAYYDALTQLPNRRMLDDRLSIAMAVSKRSGRYGALMFLDLDNFKPLNDRHGHAVGDLLLIQVAQRLDGCVREMDTVARFGGDEFVIMLTELDVDKSESTMQTRRVAEKVRSLLAEKYVLTKQQNGRPDVIIEHRCTASIGVAMFLGQEASIDDLLKWADTAMYQAKDDGRNSIWYYA